MVSIPKRGFCRFVKNTACSESLQAVLSGQAPTRPRAMLSLCVSTETPTCNTGYDLQKTASKAPSSQFSVSVDWLDITFKGIASLVEARRVLSDLEGLLNDQIEFQPYKPCFNGHAWDGQGRGARGTLIWFLDSWVDDRGDRRPAQLKVAASGQVLAGADVDVLALYLHKYQEQLAISCSRIDIALDDHDKFVKLGQIAEARREGHFFNASYSSEVCSSNRGEIESLTLYFGSPSSDKRLRIYDKEIQSDKATLGNRWEAQYRRKCANEVFGLWVSAASDQPSLVPRVLQNLVVGLIDFRYRGPEDQDRERCDLLGWFDNLLTLLSATPVKVVAPKVKQSIQKSINWISRSVAQSLAGVRAVLSQDFESWIEATIKEGGERLTNQKRYLIETTEKQQLIY